MTDLLADVPENWIRYSNANRCALWIGHSLIGTPHQSDRNYYSIPMRKGKALEPMVVEWLADHGFSLWFTKTYDTDNQLLIHAQDPFRGGHPDGFIGLIPGFSLSWWAEHHVPKMALDHMEQGNLMLLEIKTGSADSFALFKREGLSDKDNLFRGYRAQIQGYLNTVADPGNDELWDSAAFRALLAEYRYPRPQYALVVFFSPADNDFSFTIVERDPEPWKFNAERLNNKVIYPMRVEGRLPDPDYDGSHPDCYFCPYADLCPAVIAKKAAAENLDMPDLPIGMALSDDEINELVDRYYSNRLEIAALEAKQKALRAELDMAVTPDVKFQTSRYRIKRSSVKGRKTIDMETLRAVCAAQGIEIPYKEGSGYFRYYFNATYGDDYMREAE